MLAVVDAVLIAPYRWLGDPVWGWWLGSFALAMWATVLGELTLALLYLINARHIRRVATEMIRWHNLSMDGLEAGDKEFYTGANKIANEAFGKAFFMQIAMGSGSLWPAFLAAAWLDARFSGLAIPVPLTGWSTHCIAAFVALYIIARVVFGRLKGRLPFFRQTLALARRLAPEQRLRVLGLEGTKKAQQK